MFEQKSDFFSIEDAQVGKVHANFRAKMTSEGLETTQSVTHTYAILFFLHDLLGCPFTTKFCMHLAHLSVVDAKKFQNFFAIFFILLFTLV